MTIRRVATFSLFLAAAACAPVAQNARNQLAPRDGPRVSLYATYSGGLFDRSVYSYVTVDQPAYLLVAHLSGEGVIEVLYPETARDTAKVPGRKSIKTPNFYAPYDGVPYLYAMRGVVPIRDLSAKINSYDGRGHAFIFAIASDVPLHFEDISQNGLWDDVDVPNYMWNPDPRRSIKDFADAIARGAPYTLRYANSYQTTTFVSYADAAWTCSILSTFSLAALHSMGFYYGGLGSYCGGGASLFDTYFWRARSYDRGYTPTFAGGPTVNIPRRPPSPGLPTLELLPTQKRVRLAGDAEEEFSRPSRAELTTSRTLVAPRRADADAEETPRDRFDRRPIAHDYTPGSADNSPRSAPSRSSESPRSERASEMTRVEHPHVERSQPAPAAPAPAPPPPRAEPSSDSPPPPRPRPPHSR